MNHEPTPTPPLPTPPSPTQHPPYQNPTRPPQTPHECPPFQPEPSPDEPNSTRHKRRLRLRASTPRRATHHRPLKQFSIIPATTITGAAYLRSAKSRAATPCRPTNPASSKYRTNSPSTPPNRSQATQSPNPRRDHVRHPLPAPSKDKAATPTHPQKSLLAAPLSRTQTEHRHIKRRQHVKHLQPPGVKTKGTRPPSSTSVPFWPLRGHQPAAGRPWAGVAGHDAPSGQLGQRRPHEPGDECSGPMRTHYPRRAASEIEAVR